MAKKSDPPVNDTEQTKKPNINISMSMIDMLGFGMTLVKSGLNLKQSINMTIDKKMDELVHKGSLTKEEVAQAGEKFKADMGSAVDKFSGRMSDGIRKTLNRMNIATLDDVQSLEKQLDALLKELDTLGKKTSGTKKKPAPKKPRKPASPKQETPGEPAPGTKKPPKTS